jgi:alpha-galactosidase
MLYYTPQIWCSDNTDAIDRLRIQYGTSFVYPVSSVGAHVSAVPNEQTGRSVALSTRGLVAMGGTFGYELDPAKLSDSEKDQIRQQILDFKKYAHLITHGLYYRLSNPFSDGIAAWEMFAEDQSEALISVVCLEVHGNMTVNYVRLRGLRKDCFYRDEATGKMYPANALMQIGLPVPVEMGEYKSYRWHFTLVKKAEQSSAE